MEAASEDGRQHREEGREKAGEGREHEGSRRDMGSPTWQGEEWEEEPTK